MRKMRVKGKKSVREQFKTINLQHEPGFKKVMLFF